MIAMLAASTGIAPSALLAESPEMLDALVAVVFKREKSGAPELDPSSLAARMSGGR